jgi:hypothetical protein
MFSFLKFCDHLLPEIECIPKQLSTNESLSSQFNSRLRYLIIMRLQNWEKSIPVFHDVLKRFKKGFDQINEHAKFIKKSLIQTLL